MAWRCVYESIVLVYVCGWFQCCDLSFFFNISEFGFRMVFVCNVVPMNSLSRNSIDGFFQIKREMYLRKHRKRMYRQAHSANVKIV